MVKTANIKVPDGLKMRATKRNGSASKQSKKPRRKKEKLKSRNTSRNGRRRRAVKPVESDKIYIFFRGII